MCHAPNGVSARRSVSPSPNQKSFFFVGPVRRVLPLSVWNHCICRIYLHGQIIGHSFYKQIMLINVTKILVEAFNFLCNFRHFFFFISLNGLRFVCVEKVDLGPVPWHTPHHSKMAASFGQKKSSASAPLFFFVLALWADSDNFQMDIKIHFPTILHGIFSMDLWLFFSVQCYKIMEAHFDDRIIRQRIAAAATAAVCAMLMVGWLLRKMRLTPSRNENVLSCNFIPNGKLIPQSVGQPCNPQKLWNPNAIYTHPWTFVGLFSICVDWC